jgi:hypothetical protein
MGAHGGLAMSNESDAQELDGQEIGQVSSDKWPRFRIPKWWLVILLLVLIGLAGQMISISCQESPEDGVSECP